MNTLICESKNENFKKSIEATRYCNDENILHFMEAISKVKHIIYVLSGIVQMNDIEDN